jgi:thioredoxin-dependent peroxiredoxin
MRWLCVLLLIGLTAPRARGVQEGDPVPDVSAPSTSGETVNLAALKGSWVVLYFYPKAFTPGCTAESCSLRDGYGEIQKTGAMILGASFDSLETQKEFKAKHNLPFDLLSDSKKEVAKAFDSVMIGGIAAARKTFILSPEGKVARVFDKVNTGSHDDEVLEALKTLQGPAPEPPPQPVP